MTHAFAVHLPLEESYLREVMFALEVLDAVTLGRLSEGVRVKATGVIGKPIVNAGGLFVWLKEPNAQPLEIDVDPHLLPFERVTLGAAAIQMPLTRVELPPRLDYPFAPGITGGRGTLVESDVPPPARVPIPGAEAHLRWLDDDGVTMHDAPTHGHTTKDGDFAAIVRLASLDVPRLDAAGALTVRLHVKRPNGLERNSLPFALPQGRVADALPLFAWDQFLP